MLIFSRIFVANKLSKNYKKLFEKLGSFQLTCDSFSFQIVANNFWAIRRSTEVIKVCVVDDVRVALCELNRIMQKKTQ